MQTSQGRFARTAAGIALLMCAAPLQADGPCGVIVFTTAADFADEFWVNLNTVNDAGVTVNQVRVNKKPKPLPFLWVAESEAGRLARIDTVTGTILGEYRTAPQGRGLSPSRKSIDVFGNCWTANRSEGSKSPPAPLPIPGSVVKMGLVIGGTRGIKVGGVFQEDPNGEYLKPPFDYCTCVDRPEGANPPDGLIRTSRGLNNILDWPDITDGAGGGIINGVPQGGPAIVEDAVDECILVYQRVHGIGVRHVSIDDNNDLWAGGWDNLGDPPSNSPFDSLKGSTGEILATSAPLAGGYGGFVDANGILWSTYNRNIDDSKVLRFDPSNGTSSTQLSPFSYGLGLDVTGNIWNTQWADGTITKFNATGTLVFTVPSFGEGYDRGVVITPVDNDVWVANSGLSGSGKSISRLTNDGGLREVINLDNFWPPSGDVDCSEPTAVAVDAAGKIWVTCRGTSTAIRVNPSPTPPSPPSVPELKVSLGQSARPYNNSDMTGLLSLLAFKNGLWSLKHDSGTPGAFWPRVTWNSEDCIPGSGEVPTGTSITVELRAAETEAGLTRAAWRAVTNGQAIAPRPVGQWLELRAILNGKGYEVDFATPVLCDLSVEVDCLHHFLVDKDAVTGLNDGTSWANAFVDLQDALTVAEATGSGEIWVAEGAYKPTEPNGDPGIPFVLLNNVEIYGGFAGTETSRSERNPAKHVTILSGDLGNNDGPEFANYEDNSVSVVQASNRDATAVLDGFTIRAANGSGMSNGPSSHVTVNDCNFTANQGGGGGGMTNQYNSHPTLTRCTFAGNVVSDGGGGLNNLVESNPVLINCVFTGNSTTNPDTFGGGIANTLGGLLTLRNCSFFGNAAPDLGGGIYNDFDGSVSMTNCLLWGNTGSDPDIEDQQFYSGIEDGTVTVGHSSIQGWSNAFGGTNNNGSDPLFRNANGADNVTGTLDDDLRLRPLSPSIDSGNNAGVLPGETDRDGNPRILGGAVNRGAYEGFDCNGNLTPDDVDTPTLVSAYSRKANVSGPGGICDLPASTGDTCLSEPRVGGITEVRFAYNASSANSCLSYIEQASEAAPEFTAYSGASVPTCVPSGNELVCTFSPALENAYTYRFNVTGGRARLRGLVGDVDSTGWTNATDRSVVVGVWTSPAGFSCLTDLNSSGQTNSTDRSIVVGAWTGPNNKAPCPGPIPKVVAASSTSGWRGGTPRIRPGFLPGVLQRKTGDSDETGSEESWNVIQGQATLEVRPVEGGPGAPGLIAGQRYEVSYSGASHPVEAYALLVSSSACDTAPITDVQAANTASPTESGLFEFVGVETDSSSNAGGELHRCGMALDDQSGSGWLGGTEGTICIFTADATGTLRLELWLSFVHESDRTTYETAATSDLEVSE